MIICLLCWTAIRKLVRMMTKIYFDNAATTAMIPECIKIMGEFACNNFYNPSALYGEAIKVKKDLNDARAVIANALGANSQEEIIFTASGTEADNMAVFGGLKSKKGKILVSKVEHSAVFNAVAHLKNKGYEVVELAVDKHGRIDIEEYAKAIDDSVVFASIVHVSNETGAINDIKTLCNMLKKVAPCAVFHSDGVQAFGKIPLSVQSLGVDLYSVSAHKIGGPKGVGALYKRRGFNLKPLIFGGGQEFGLRSATENVAGIIAFAKATELISVQRIDSRLKNALSEKLMCYDDIIINTDIQNSAPHILNFAMQSVRGEVMLHSLENYGILVGTGSACSSNKGEARLTKALGLRGGFEQGVLRISFGCQNTLEEVHIFIDAFEREYLNLKKYKRV